MDNLKNIFSQVVVSIGTPYATGTGFYLQSDNLVVTSEYAVRDNREVIVEGKSIQRQLMEVVLTDFQTDLAFLRPVQALDLPPIPLYRGDLMVGTEVWALGLPFGQPFQMISGHVQAVDYESSGQNFLQIAANVPNAIEGGPLVNAQGEVLGVNTLLVPSDEQSTYALPVGELQQLLEEFKQNGGRGGNRCGNCQKMAYSPAAGVKKTCMHCGIKLFFPSQLPSYVPTGIAQTIEHLIGEAGYEAALTRRGPNNWEIQEGSARVNISYYEKNGLIIGDAYLCELPLSEEKPLLEYLLKQNCEIEGLTFSIRDQSVVLSLLIYDRYFNEDIGSKLFQHLLERADYYDNILVEQYGAKWREPEEG